MQKFIFVLFSLVTLVNVHASGGKVATVSEPTRAILTRLKQVTPLSLFKSWLEPLNTIINDASSTEADAHAVASLFKEAEKTAKDVEASNGSSNVNVSRFYFFLRKNQEYKNLVAQSNAIGRGAIKTTLLAQKTDMQNLYNKIYLYALSEMTADLYDTLRTIYEDERAPEVFPNAVPKRKSYDAEVFLEAKNMFDKLNNMVRGLSGIPGKDGLISILDQTKNRFEMIAVPSKPKDRVGDDLTNPSFKRKIEPHNIITSSDMLALVLGGSDTPLYLKRQVKDLMLAIYKMRNPGKKTPLEFSFDIYKEAMGAYGDNEYDKIEKFFEVTSLNWSSFGELGRIKSLAKQNPNGVLERTNDALYMDMLVNSARYAGEFREVYHSVPSYILFNVLLSGTINKVLSLTQTAQMRVKAENKNVDTFLGEYFDKYDTDYKIYANSSSVQYSKDKSFFDDNPNMARHLMSTSPSVFMDKATESTIYYFRSGSSITVGNDPFAKISKSYLDHLGFSQIQQQRYNDYFKELFATKYPAITALIQIFMREDVIGSMSYLSHSYGIPVNLKGNVQMPTSKRYKDVNDFMLRFNRNESNDGTVGTISDTTWGNKTLAGLLNSHYLHVHVLATGEDFLNPHAVILKINPALGRIGRLIVREIETDLTRMLLEDIQQLTNNMHYSKTLVSTNQDLRPFHKLVREKSRLDAATITKPKNGLEFTGKNGWKSNWGAGSMGAETMHDYFMTHLSSSSTKSDSAKYFENLRGYSWNLLQSFVNSGPGHTQQKVFAADYKRLFTSLLTQELIGLVEYGKMSGIRTLFEQGFFLSPTSYQFPNKGIVLPAGMQSLNHQGINYVNLQSKPISAMDLIKSLNSVYDNLNYRLDLETNDARKQLLINLMRKVAVESVKVASGVNPKVKAFTQVKEPGRIDSEFIKANKAEAVKRAKARVDRFASVQALQNFAKSYAMANVTGDKNRPNFVAELQNVFAYKKSSTGQVLNEVANYQRSACQMFAAGFYFDEVTRSDANNENLSKKWVKNSLPKGQEPEVGLQKIEARLKNRDQSYKKDLSANAEINAFLNGQNFYNPYKSKGKTVQEYWNAVRNTEYFGQISTGVGRVSENLFDIVTQ